MARSRDIEYRVGFSGDISLLEAAVKKATDSLNKLGTSPDKLRLGLDGAARSALELSNHLSTAFNLNTGKLDLIKFRQQLDASGRSLEAYAADLRKLGPEGEQAFLEMASAIGKAELPLRRTNNIVKQFGVTLWNTARWRITTSAINTIVGGLLLAYGYSKSLDASLNSIRIVTKKSADDMALFAKQANAAAKTLSTTTTAYTDASLIFYQQGLSDELVAARTETTIKMANVTGQAAEDISSQMTAIWNNFEDGSKSLENYADSIVALGASTAASSKEIAEGLLKFAPIAETVGLSFDYASAALTTIVLNTRESATAAGTSLKTLFSRLEGLKLGETLDDGTDLNKYSNALMAVGINIKDASGLLKDMDLILDELGAKWKTLARDLQMALAETVGGVRQYAQLVALMDNWSDFLKNLVTSRAADGELQKLADIYAESWEAARNRVKAASEDIYDSLINPELFIKLDNILTPFLTNVASMVDAMGGLTGLLPIITSLMTLAFGDKIAQSLRNMTVNMGLMTGATLQRARELQEIVTTTAQELNLADIGDEVASRKIEILREEVGLYGEINGRLDNMTLSQRELVEARLKIVDVLKEEALKTAEVAEASRLAVLQARGDLVTLMDLWTGATTPFMANAQGNAFLSTSFMSDINTSIVQDFEGTLDKLIDKLLQVVETSGELRTLRTAFADVNTVTQENIDAALKLLAAYDRLPQNVNDVNEIRQSLTNLTREANASREALTGILRLAGYGKGEIKAFTVAVNGASEAAANNVNSLDNMTAGMERAGLVARLSKFEFMDWADAIVGLGTAASKAAIGVRAIQNLANVFDKDNDMKTSERWSLGLMSGGMLIGSLSPILTKLKGSGKAVSNDLDISGALKNVTKALDTVALSTKNVAASMTAVGTATRVTLDAWDNYAIATNDARDAQKALTKATKNLEGATSYSGTAALTYALAIIDEQTASRAAEKAATELLSAKTAEATARHQAAVATMAEVKAKEELAAAEQHLLLVRGAAKDSLIAGGVAAAAIVAVVAAVVLAIKYVNDYKEKIKELNKEKIEAADKTQEEIAANQSLITSYNELLDVYKRTGEGKEDLDAKAQELADAYGIEGAALAKLTGDYETFNAKVAQASQAKLREQLNTLLEGANASINYNGFERTVLDESMLQQVNEAGLGMYVQFLGAQQVLEITTNSYEELLSVRNRLLELDKQGFGNGIKDLIAKINEELRKALGYIDQAAIIEILLKAPDGSDISSYADFKAWKDLATEVLNLSTRIDTSNLNMDSILEQAALNLGLDEWLLILAVQSDLEESLRYYPLYLSQAKEKLEDINSLDDAKLLAYFPWSLVDEQSSNFGTLMTLTRAYVEALEEGALAALNYADALKLLLKVLSGSALKAKDLKDYLALFDNDIEKFKEFLNSSPESRESLLNTLIQDSFAKTQEINNNRIAEIGAGLDALGLGTGKLAEALKAQKLAYEAIRADMEGDFGSAVSDTAVNAEIARVAETQHQWELTRVAAANYFKELEAAGSDKDAISKVKENYKDFLSQVIPKGTLEDTLALIDRMFEDDIPDNVGKYIKAGFEVSGLENERDSLTESTGLELAAYEYETNLMIEQIKTLGDLNKLQRTRNLNTDQYNKAITNLAKKIPAATKILNAYNEELRKEAPDLAKLAELQKELADALQNDAIEKAGQAIKKVNDELIQAGATIEKNGDKLTAEEYEKKINEIGTALQEAFGVDVSANWVLNHHKVIEDLLSDDIETAKLAAYLIQFASLISSEAMKPMFEGIITDANKVAAAINILDGMSFDIDGKANLSSVIDALLKVGVTAVQIADILNAIGSANIGFSVSGIPNRNDEKYWVDVFGIGRTFDVGAYTADLKNAVLQGTGGVDTSGLGIGGGKGGGGGSKKDQTKDLEDTSNRYHEINRELERQDRILSEIEKKIARTYGTNKIKAYQEQQDALNEKIKQQQYLYDEASRHLQEDREKLFALDENGLPNGFAAELGTYSALKFPSLTSYGEFVGYDESGNALYSYQTLRDEIVEKYNTAVEGMKDDAEAKEALDKWFEHVTGWLDDYENSLDTYNKTIHEIKETERQLEDSKLNEIKYKVEVAIDIRDARKQMREFSKSIEESFGDMVTHGIKAAKAIQTATEGNISDEIAMFQTYATEYAELQERLANATDATDINAIVDELKNLESNIISSGEALLEWLETVENMYADTLKDAADRFEAFTDLIAHDTDIIGMIKELYALLGVTYKTQENYYKLQKASQGEYTGYMRQALLNRTWYEKSQAELAKYEEEIKKLRDTIDTTGLTDALIQQKLEEDVRYDALKKSRDALVEESNKAQKAMLENAQSAMETARQIYLDAIDKYAYDVEQRLSRGLGFDLLQDKYDHFIEKSERYLDPIEEGLEAATWYSKLDADIQQTTNKAYQERLKALKNEVDTRRELNTLSQYDLDIIEARYQVLQAEMALEDAKNNKNTLRLVRDSQGNWNYQYTANPDDVAAKEQELLGARKNEYEITKNRYKELNDELLKMTQEWAEKDKKIRLDVVNGILTEAEGQKRLDELQNFYTLKAEYLKTELDIAVEDMQTAATTSADLVSLLSENAYDTTENMMRDLKNSFTSYLDEMSGYLILNFEPAVVEYVGNAEEAFTTFKGQIQETANTIGVNPDSLNAMVSILTDDMNSLYSEADAATRALWDLLQLVRGLQIGYQLLTVDVMNAVRAMELLNSLVVGSIESAGNRLSDEVEEKLPYVGDLSQLIAAAKYNKDDAKYRELLAARADAIADTTGVMSNADLVISLNAADRDLLKAYATGQAYILVDSNLDADQWKEVYGKTGAPTVMIASGATGMYTGEFEGGKLGILHQKELVLNAEDTKNMLAAVEVVRGLLDSVFATIGKTLDGNAAAAYAMLGSRFNTAMSLAPALTELEQHVTIELVNFPNVTSSREIEEAFENLVNDAAQWARRRKS